MSTSFRGNNLINGFFLFTVFESQYQFADIGFGKFRIIGIGSAGENGHLGKDFSYSMCSLKFLHFSHITVNVSAYLFTDFFIKHISPEYAFCQNIRKIGVEFHEIFSAKIQCIRS